MPQPKQNLQNHARYVPLFHLVTFGILVAVLARAIIAAKEDFSVDSGFNVALAAALVLLAWFARAFPLAAQNRVIRLELRLRMQAIAPAQAAQFDEFNVAQVTALRFAGDAELPALAQRVLDGTLTSGNAIKREIKDWQADHWRV